MSKKLVLFDVVDGTLHENGYEFETEIGWVIPSGIFAKETYHIPNELEDLDPIEVLWLMRQVGKSLLSMKDNGKIADISDELIIELVKEIYEDHESIDQDVDWRVKSYLNKRV